MISINNDIENSEDTKKPVKRKFPKLNETHIETIKYLNENGIFLHDEIRKDVTLEEILEESPKDFIISEFFNGKWNETHELYFLIRDHSTIAITPEEIDDLFYHKNLSVNGTDHEDSKLINHITQNIVNFLIRDCGLDNPQLIASEYFDNIFDDISFFIKNGYMHTVAFTEGQLDYMIWVKKNTEPFSKEDVPFVNSKLRYENYFEEKTKENIPNKPLRCRSTIQKIPEESYCLTGHIDPEGNLVIYQNHIQETIESGKYVFVKVSDFTTLQFSSLPIAKDITNDHTG